MATKIKSVPSSLMSKIQSTCKIEGASILKDSNYFEINEYVDLEIPVLNIAMSGEIDKGLYYGLHTIARWI